MTPKAPQADPREIEKLRQQVAALQQAFGAIRSGAVEAMGEGAAMISTFGKILYANQQLAELLLCERQTLIGRPFDTLVSASQQLQLENLGALRSAQTSHAALDLVRADGSLKEVEFVSNAYLVGEQRVIQCNIRDISDRRAAERLAQTYQQETLRSLQEIVAPLVGLSEARDPYTVGHQSRLAELATAIATEMGLDEHRIEGIRISGLVHDIGKFAIPAELLVKPTALKKEEMALIRTHVQEGWMCGCRFTSPGRWPRPCSTTTSALMAAATPRASRVRPSAWRADPWRYRHRGSDGDPSALPLLQRPRSGP